MGGCATKPKATKGDDLDSAQAPAPAPLPVKDEPETVTEAKEIVDVKGVEGEAKVEGADDKAGKKGDDGEVDEQQNKPRSLGHLLDENEEKESTESGKTVETAGVQPEPQKEKQVEEQETKTEKATEASNSTAPETEEAKIPEEEKPTPTPVAAERVETEKPTEAASDNKTEKPQSSETKPVEEDVKGSTVNDAKVTEEPQKSEPRQETSALPVYSSAKVSGNEAETK